MTDTRRRHAMTFARMSVSAALAAMCLTAAVGPATANAESIAGKYGCLVRARAGNGFTPSNGALVLTSGGGYKFSPVNVVAPGGSGTFTGPPGGTYRRAGDRLTFTGGYLDGRIAVWAAPKGGFGLFDGSATITFRSFPGFGSGGGGAEQCLGKARARTGPNRRPHAHNDLIGLIQGVLKPVDVTANDTDADGDTLHVVGHGRAKFGRAHCSATTCSYDGGARFHGHDNFPYTISDGHGHTVSARVFVRVRPHTRRRSSRRQAGDGIEPPTTCPAGFRCSARLKSGATTARRKRFTWNTWATCSFSDDGADGLGIYEIHAWLRENGPSGVDRFSIGFRTQVYGRSWSGLGDPKWITVDERESTANVGPGVLDAADTWFPGTGNISWRSSWGANAATTGPWRLQVRGKWIRRGVIDRVRYDSTWQTRCQGQPTLE